MSVPVVPPQVSSPVPSDTSSVDQSVRSGERVRGKQNKHQQEQGVYNIRPDKGGFEGVRMRGEVSLAETGEHAVLGGDIEDSSTPSSLSSLETADIESEIHLERNISAVSRGISPLIVSPSNHRVANRDNDITDKGKHTFIPISDTIQASSVNRLDRSQETDPRQVDQVSFARMSRPVRKRPAELANLDDRSIDNLQQTIRNAGLEELPASLTSPSSQHICLCQKDPKIPRPRNGE
jgi:hypothetical protein